MASASLPAPVAELYPIDGAVDLAAVGAVHEKTIDILDTFGTGTFVKTAVLRWAAANDERKLEISRLGLLRPVHS